MDKIIGYIDKMAGVFTSTRTVGSFERVEMGFVLLLGDRK